MVEKKTTIDGVYMTEMLRGVYTTEKLVQTSQKQWYRPVSFVKKYWSLRTAIGAYMPLNTPVFFFKRYWCRTPFWTGPDQIFFSLNTPLKNYFFIKF